MLDTLRQTGKNIGRELERTWETLSEGWREMLGRNSNALTHFSGKKDDAPLQNAGSIVSFPRWGLLAGEVEEKDGEIVVRVEVPGMEKENFNISIDGNELYLSGEKHYERETHDSTYHVMERAYGSFRRSIHLPHNVDADQARAHYVNGVLSIHLPKVKSDSHRRISLT